MSLRKTGIGAGIAAAALAWATAALAVPQDYQLGLQPAASPVMEQIETFHTLLVWIIVAISVFVAALLVWIIIRYNKRANPVPSKTHHNTLLEVAWTIIPVIILV
ncbi:MAG TPA: cytochrome c oxidase subunit II transmembrane domain-containing protein, partial [Rhizomicrobium sp.]